MNIFVVFYCEDGHIYRLAEAIAEGARSVANGTSVEIYQVGDSSQIADQDQREVQESRRRFAHIPHIAARELVRADAVIFGTPSKFGMMAVQMRNFLNEMEPLWVNGDMIGKVSSVFTSATMRNGGQESMLAGFHVALLHLGMIIIGIPYCEKRLLPMEPISGKNSYGSTPVNMPHPLNYTEASIARFQGQHVAEITRFLVRGRELSAGQP